LVTWTRLELDEVESTQSLAAGLAAKGALEGTVVTSKSQSAGKGRLGRDWVSPPGGLYMSVILRPSRLARPQLISIVFALAVVEGIKTLTGLPARIRWPNDIIVGTSKIGGVIAEGQSYGREVTQLVVGVGVNCNAAVRGVKPGGEMATSLAEELGHKVRIPELRDSILDSFSRLYDRWRTGEDLIPLWAGSVGTIGMSARVKVRGGRNEFRCRVVGLDSEGGLVIDRNGKKAVLKAEDLERLRETP